MEFQRVYQKETPEPYYNHPERHYCVYVHINKLNHKKYVGMTGQKPEHRWKRGRGYDKNPYFGKAVKKYDWDQDFKHEILKDGLTCDEAKTLETFYIKKFRTTEPDKGYNISMGGDCPINIGSEVIQFDKAGNILQVYPSTHDASRKTGVCHTAIVRCCRTERFYAGQYRWMYKKDYLKYGFIPMAEKRVSKEVCELTESGELIMVYKTIKEASEKTGLLRSAISRACRGYLKETGGKRWMFLSDYEITKGVINHYEGRIIQISNQYEYIDEFESPQLAAKELEVPVRAVDYALETGNQCRDFFWIKAETAEKHGLDYEGILLKLESEKKESSWN